MRPIQLRDYVILEAYHGRPRRWLWLRVVKTLFRGHGMRGFLILMRTTQYCHERGWTELAAYLQAKQERIYACYISREASISEGLCTPHPVGIVVGDGVTIGRRCVIYQNVTLGGARRGDGIANLYPKVGDDVTIFAGAVIVGNIRIGSRVTIGANAVVLNDVPDDSTAVGVPARVVLRTAKMSWGHTSMA